MKGGRRATKRVSAPSSKRLKEALSFSLFANLDADLVHRIFSFLSQPQALQARLVCRRWADLARYHVHRVDAADDPDIVREVSETFPHWQEINLLYQMPCVTVAEWRAIVEGLGPRIVNVRRLSLCVDGENDRIVLQETFRLLVSFTRLTHLRIVGENVAQQDRREFWAGLLSLLETNQESLENIAIGFEWEPGSGTFPALPRLRVVRMYCDSSVLDALSASPHLEMIEAHGWAENCTEESRVRFAQAHPKLMRVCIDIPLAPSTRMLAGPPQCKVENGANDMIPLGMGSSMYFVLTQTVLIDDLDASRIRMICIKKPYNTAEMIQLAAKCPNLEALDIHDSFEFSAHPQSNVSLGAKIACRTFLVAENLAAVSQRPSRLQRDG